MQDRRKNLEAFKDGDVRFLICTDVAARGIDIRGLPFVVNMTLPDNAEQYIHRIGRVGRAEKLGLAISLVRSTHLDV
jgi:ATP-dependent RNA helicase DDX1